MFTRAWRLRRYRRLMNANPLTVTDSDTIVNHLQQLWRCIQPKDLLPLPAAYRTQTVLTVCYPNLPGLVRALNEQNQLIAKEADSQLERRLARATRETVEVELDFYLADDDHLPVDEAVLLTRLRGLLQAHHGLVNRHTSHYYERHSEMLYKDVVTLTHALLDHHN